MARKPERRHLALARGKVVRRGESGDGVGFLGSRIGIVNRGTVRSGAGDACTPAFFRVCTEAPFRPRVRAALLRTAKLRPFFASVLLEIDLKHHSSFAEREAHGNQDEHDRNDVERLDMGCEQGSERLSERVSHAFGDPSDGEHEMGFDRRLLRP